ncbi:methyl-accepting chemotaxis protein [Rhizomicrobium palustre]|uniref:Methyl-accepting chemotaxis protein n=1 Tax=Rhizomicrobium palustre TaxID=189966 RepID=A0A846MZD2_9PROT|nr:methyl-accepting chemotaxis protein [Rhizomicrobium palustre]NIK88595.1 methyl-accepting chemotaxis protein [Rhizomicrobium palustre]
MSAALYRAAGIPAREDITVRFKDVAVSKKLWGVFALLLAVTIGLGLFAVASLSEVNNNSVEVRDNWLPGLGDLSQFEYNMTRARVAQANFAMASTDAQRVAMTKSIARYRAEADAYWAKYAASIDDGEERALADKIVATRQEYEPLQDRLDEIIKTQGRDAGVAFFLGEMRAKYTVFIASVEKDVAFNRAAGIAAGNKGAQTYAIARILILIALIVAASLCVVAAIVLVRGISKPLTTMTEAMSELARGHLQAHVPHADQKDEIGKLAEAMTSFKDQLLEAERAKEEQTKVIVSSIGAGLDHLARGDLTHRVTANLSGAFAKLKGDFNSAMERMQDTVKNVLDTSHQIAGNADEISSAADDLSRRTEQQAASLEETAAALEEITVTVKKTASNAREASRSATVAKQAAESSGQVVKTAVTAMDAIAQSSQQITDIIGVIDEIAFQTNLLALNAGVEAARAGDAGRGFAVVASEVRALAQRSSEAAKQIKGLIATSSAHVGEGVKYVGETGQALKRIVDQVLEINGLVGEMAQAAEQQSTGIEQVNAAISQMDQVTQQNAAMVEESTAASRNLASETKALTQMVQFFSVGETRAAAPVVARPAPVATRPTPARKAVALQPAGHSRTAAAVAVAEAAPQNDWEEF